MSVIVNVPGLNVPVYDSNGTWIVLSIRAEPDGSEVKGDAILVAPLGLGPYQGHGNSVAIQDGSSGWLFIGPKEGQKSYIADTDTTVVFDGSSWVQAPDYATIGNLDSSTLFSKAPVENTANTPDVTPTVGMRRLIGASPTGVWAGKENQVAEYFADGWHCSGVPKPGQVLAVGFSKQIYGVTSGWVKIGRWVTSSTLNAVLDEPTLEDMSAACVSAGSKIILDTDYELATDETINVDVRIDNGTITTAAHSITFTGRFDAPKDAMVFEAGGAGLITFEKNKECFLEWFSPARDGVTADNNPLKRMMGAGAPKCYLGEGDIGYTETLQAVSNRYLKGEGKSVTVFKKLANKSAISLEQPSPGVDLTDVEIWDIGFHGNKDEFSTWAGEAITSYQGGIRRVKIKRCGCYDDASGFVCVLAKRDKRSSDIEVAGCEWDWVGAHGVVMQSYVDSPRVVRNIGKNKGMTIADRIHISVGRYSSNAVVFQNELTQTLAGAGGAMAHMISLDMTYAPKCQSNIMDGGGVNEGYGIEEGYVSSGHVTNNTIHGCVRSGINLSGDATTTTDTTFYDGEMDAASAVLTSTEAAFGPWFLGRYVMASGAGPGGNVLVGRIIEVATDGGSVVLDVAASASVTNATLFIPCCNFGTVTAGNIIRRCGTGISTSMEGFALKTRSTDDFAINAGSATLTSATFGFAATYVGRGVTIPGAGPAGGDLVTVIKSINSSMSVTVWDAASTSVTGKTATVAELIGFHAGGSVIGNIVEDIDGAGLDLEHIVHFGIHGNIGRRCGTSALITDYVNYSSFSDNEGYNCNTTQNGSHAGLRILLRTAVGLEVAAWNNRMVGNGSGGGGARDNMQTVDGDLADNQRVSPAFISTGIAAMRDGGLAIGEPGAGFTYYTTRSVQTRVNITFSSDITLDLATGAVQVITVTNTGAWSLQNPENAIANQLWNLLIVNSSGGTIATPSVGGTFLVSGIGFPANGKRRLYTFFTDNDGANVLMSQGADQ